MDQSLHGSFCVCDPENRVCSVFQVHITASTWWWTWAGFLWVTASRQELWLWWSRFLGRWCTRTRHRFYAEVGKKHLFYTFLLVCLVINLSSMCCLWKVTGRPITSRFMLKSTTWAATVWCGRGSEKTSPTTFVLEPKSCGGTKGRCRTSAPSNTSWDTTVGQTVFSIPSEVIRDVISGDCFYFRPQERPLH